MSQKMTFTILSIFLLLVCGSLAYAYNSGNAPSVFGHSAEEIEVTIDGNTMTLNDFATQFPSILESTVIENELFFFTNRSVVTAPGHGRWLACGQGQGIVGIASSNTNSEGIEDVDAIECEYVGVGQDKSYIDNLNGKHGGSVASDMLWNMDCNSYLAFGGLNQYMLQEERVLTGLWNDNNNYNDIDEVSCSIGNVDDNDCEVISMTSTPKWKSCSDGYVATALYDDNNQFGHVDAMKCCRIQV